MSIEGALDGRLGGPPTVRTSQKGTRWASLSLAVSAGEDKPEWVSVSCFGEVMDSLPADLTKGERVYVEGKLRLNRYVDKEGKERVNLQVNATRALLLDRIGRRRRPSRVKAGKDQTNGEVSAATSAPPTDRPRDDWDGEIPF